MKHTLLLLTVFLSLPLASFGQKKLELNLIQADTTWGQEVFTFPIKFAPNIPLEGIEDARFAKGWSKPEHPEYWTYTFAWHVNVNEDLETTELTHYLSLYFDGLITDVNSNRNFTVPPAVITLMKQKVKGIPSFEGTLVIHDAFITKKTIRLNTRIRQYPCKNDQESLVIFTFSTMPFEHVIWTKLNAIRPQPNLFN